MPSFNFCICPYLCLLVFLSFFRFVCLPSLTLGICLCVCVSFSFCICPFFSVCLLVVLSFFGSCLCLKFYVSSSVCFFEWLYLSLALFFSLSISKSACLCLSASVSVFLFPSSSWVGYFPLSFLSHRSSFPCLSPLLLLNMSPFPLLSVVRPSSHRLAKGCSRPALHRTKITVLATA